MINQIQKAYMEAKAAYDTAFKMEDWDLVDQLEDPYLDAEIALVDWSFDECVKTGKFSRSDADLLRRNSNEAQWKKFVDMALRLAV